MVTYIPSLVMVMVILVEVIPGQGIFSIGERILLWCIYTYTYESNN